MHYIAYGCVYSSRHDRITTDMDEEIIARILDAYGVKYTKLLPVEKGYRNENHPFVTPHNECVNLIIYKREPGIKERIMRANRIADYLAGHGFGARRTYDRRIIQLYEGKYAALYQYLPGKTIPWEAYTMKHLKALGKAMGDMHALLSAADARDLPDAADEYIAIEALFYGQCCPACYER
jgi:Ser/Thr protein kinase RdoA (MazF antagonist)